MLQPGTYELVVTTDLLGEAGDEPGEFVSAFEVVLEVPAPATAMLLAAPLLGAGVRRRR